MLDIFALQQFRLAPYQFTGYSVYITRVESTSVPSRRAARRPPSSLLLSERRRRECLLPLWTTPVAQELLYNDEHRSVAPMCSACSRSTGCLLPLTKSAERPLIHAIAPVAMCPLGFADLRFDRLSGAIQAWLCQAMSIALSGVPARPQTAFAQVRVGEDAQEMPNVLPVYLRVVRNVRPKYSCRTFDTHWKA